MKHLNVNDDYKDCKLYQPYPDLQRWGVGSKSRWEFLHLWRCHVCFDASHETPRIINQLLERATLDFLKLPSPKKEKQSKEKSQHFSQMTAC